jgi:hypothetical protein
MSYELADGSKSTDYKIGDIFQPKHSDRTFILNDDDGSSCPWFVECGTTNEASRYWGGFIPVKAKKNASLVNQLRSTIRYLERTIAELES